jgi:Flp pilus assembly protein TadG
MSAIGVRRPDPALAVRRPDAEAGTAIVEFVLLAVLLMVPLVYLVLVSFRLQSTAYALAAATRESGRAFVTAPDTETAALRAQAAALVALHDHGVELAEDALRVECEPACRLEPGTAVTVRIATVVPLPLLPDVLGGDRLTITVDGTHVEYVERYASAR